jgi:LuxR family transcriptional regulator, maltose regulon positive regulatory protein
VSEPSTAVRPPSGAVLTATKIEVPGVRAGLVPRARLVAMLTGASEAKLALIQAPVGSGKTTLLAEWHAAAEATRPFAWLSLDRGDNDPVRFLEGVIAALRTVVPGAGEQALVDLAGPASLTDVVLPSLVNDLAAQPQRLVLVLDDYHVIGDPRVHEAVTFVLDHQPATLTLALATRAEPPLPLGRLRVRRELVDVRAQQLRFSDDEATTLLNRRLGLELDPGDVARLQHRTEGWAAGLQLAALSLSGREDRRLFISSFAGDDRPVVDYLGFEVLDGQPPDVREFLLQTSVLERMCGSLCDHVTGRDDSALKLDELERAGLLLVPLDSRREWYRYHHLFAGLLRHELTRTRPGLVPALHRRASAWYREIGSVGEAVDHAIAGGDAVVASALITEHWYAELQRGRIETVAGWLESLGDELVRAQASLCLTKAWIAVNTGRLDEVAEWIDAAERAGADEPVLAGGVASLQEIHRYMAGDVERAVEAGRRSVQSGDTPWRPVGCPVLGIALFWSGAYGEAAAELESATDTARAAGNHLAVIHASGALAAMRAERGELETADTVAQAALRLAQERGLYEHWATTLARVVHARGLERRGLIADAAGEIDRGVELSTRGVATLEIAYARLAQADARQLRGDPGGAAEAARRARRLIERCAAPELLSDMLARTERRLHLASRRVRVGDGAPVADELTDRELSVLRLLPTGLSQREIGDALFISLNTVKSHARSIYRKLNVDARDEAVEQARALGLL